MAAIFLQAKDWVSTKITPGNKFRQGEANL